LAPNVGRYLYVSTVSVYVDYSITNYEDSPLATIADETVEEVTGETYGALKALCEKRAAAEFDADRFTILRPTYICGPGDHTDRFSYWPIRTRKGGEMLWPGTPSDPVQIVDVRDLAYFTIGKLLQDSQAVSATEVDAIWMDEQFLTANGLAGGRDLPVWHGATDAMDVSADRALAAGFQNRPERETARDLLTWWDTLPEERRAKPKAGMTAEKETEVIAAWKAHIA